MSFESLLCCRRSFLVMSALSLVLLALLKNLTAFREATPHSGVVSSRKTELEPGNLSNNNAAETNGQGIGFESVSSKAIGGKTVLDVGGDSRDTDFAPGAASSDQQIGFTPSDQLIVAFYYPWYDQDRWQKYGTQGHHPLLGNYSSNETTLAEQHVDWAVDRGGIDVWAVSWWNKQSPGAQRFIDGMLHAKNIAKIKFTMVYEATGALPIRDFANGTRALNKFIADMMYFRELYFSHSSYLRINGRPVVYLYITRSFKNFTSSMLDTIKTRVGEDILFIADEAYYRPQHTPQTAKNGIRNATADEAYDRPQHTPQTSKNGIRNATADKAYDRPQHTPQTAKNGIRKAPPVFEAYSSYNMYQYYRVKKGEDAVDFMFREALPIYARWSRQTVFFPHVLPKYHDFRPGHPKLLGDSEGLMTQLKTFACLPRPSWYTNEFPDLLFVTSFNEWFEGSSIEPDLEDEYGFAFLDTIKAFKESGVWAKCRDIARYQYTAGTIY